MNATAVLLALALAGASSPNHYDVRLEVDADALGTIDEYYDHAAAESLVHADVTELLEAERIVLSDEKEAALLRISLFWKDVEVGIIGVSVEVDAPDHDPRSMPVFYCENCLHVDLGGRIEQEMPKIVNLLAHDEVTETDGGSTPPPTGGPLQTDHPKRKAIGPVGIVGLIVAAFGVGSLVAGGVVFARNRDGETQDDLARTTFDTSVTAGTAWMLVGAGALVVGGAMMAVDLTVLAKKRRAKQRNTTLAPSLAPDQVGLTLRGRF